MTTTRLLRGVGWLFIAAGATVALYLVYSLLFTNLETAQAQGDLSEEWNLSIGDVDGRIRETGAGGDAAELSDVKPGSAVAVLQFRRAGTGTPVVHDEPLFVVKGVGLSELTRGPGHYPGTALPGGKGNFAVAGHRTTYGAPFFNLDDLQPGDEIFATGRDGVRHTYRVTKQEIVAPTDTWVIEPDPLDTDKPTLTLTTCHPRFSNRQRMVVFAELVS